MGVQIQAARYIKADNIFSVINSHHGNVYKVHKMGQEIIKLTNGEYGSKTFAKFFERNMP